MAHEMITTFKYNQRSHYKYIHKFKEVHTIAPHITNEELLKKRMDQIMQYTAELDFTFLDKKLVQPQKSQQSKMVDINAHHKKSLELLLGSDFIMEAIKDPKFPKKLTKKQQYTLFVFAKEARGGILKPFSTYEKDLPQAMIEEWKAQYNKLQPRRSELPNPNPRKLTSQIPRDPSDISSMLINAGLKQCLCHNAACVNGEICGKKSQSLDRTNNDSMNQNRQHPVSFAS